MMTYPTLLRCCECSYPAERLLWVAPTTPDVDRELAVVCDGCGGEVTS